MKVFCFFYLKPYRVTSKRCIEIVLKTNLYFLFFFFVNFQKKFYALIKPQNNFFREKLRYELISRHYSFKHFTRRSVQIVKTHLKDLSQV